MNQEHGLDLTVREVFVVDAVRSPMAKRRGGLSGSHSAYVLGQVLNELLVRNGLTGDEVDEVLGGCVSQAGMQASNVTRWAWLSAGLPEDVGATTVDAQCGSSEQTLALGRALIASGQAEVIIACGVELMSRVPMGSPIPRDRSLGSPVTRGYLDRYEYTSQFDSADRIARKWGFSREDCDAYAVSSQQRAAAAQAGGVFESQIVPVRALPYPEVASSDEAQAPLVSVDEGPRPTTAESLAGLEPILPDGIHSAGNASQMTDAAAAVLLMSAERAAALGLRPLVEILDTCLVGSDPVLKLTGPIAATGRLLDRTGLTMPDLDVVEINEAFASVVLAWIAEWEADPAIVNPNGGAIALGHPLGATGAVLLAKAVHELIRSDRTHALVTICCGAGMATGAILRRV
jgi:acetyl-CoA C-acetyltransferase